MSVADKDKVLDAEAIRVNTTVNSTKANTGEFQAQTIVIDNGLDKTVAIQLQGSIDGTTWFDINVPFNVGSGLKDYDTVTDYFPCYRVTAKCSVAPTSGVLNAWVLKSGGK